MVYCKLCLDGSGELLDGYASSDEGIDCGGVKHGN
jgi:hypothetical protein